MLFKASHLSIAASMLLPWPACARVVRVVVEKSTAHDAANGTSGYTELQGVAYGELDPADPANAVIQDLALAPRDANGRVVYATTFTLEMPTDPGKDSGFLLYEVVNRGSSIVPRDLSRGDIFLRSGWQGDIAFRGRTLAGGPAESIDLPVAHQPDGDSITGPALLRFINVRAGTHTVPTSLAVGYASSGAPPLPADPADGQAVMVSRSFESVDGVIGGDTVVPADAWRWADCTTTPFPGRPDPKHLCLRDGFDPALAYSLTYRAKDPKVLGIGLAAIRDINTFFSTQEKDDTGWRNPLSGRIRQTIVEGASQSGNTIRTFLNLGFNRDAGGHRVFAGAMVMIAARQNPINFRFAIPGGASSLYEPGSDGPVWWADWPDPVRGLPAAGLLTRCTQSNTCPKIVEVLGSSEFWSLRASPDYVGTDGQADIPLPPEVRRYYIAGTSHGGGVGGFQWAAKSLSGPRPATPDNPITAEGCALPMNPNPERETDAALLADLKLWVERGISPPPSQYPTLQHRDLVPANRASMGTPVIPGVPAPDGVANPLLLYDFGPDFCANDLSGFLDRDPPHITGAVYPLVPRVDSDGNETAGIHTVLQQAPLGTYQGWNVTDAGFHKGQYCSLYGSYIPFPRTIAERKATHDPRRSLAERYGTQRGYTCAVQKAAERLVSERLLLRNDANTMENAARALPELPADDKASPADRAIADALCR